MQVTSLQILLSYSYTQKKKSEREKREKKKADKCLPPITQLICPLISPNLRSAFLYFFKHFFCPPLTAHIWTVGGSYLLGECIYVGRGLFTGESVTVTVSTSSTLP